MSQMFFDNPQLELKEIEFWKMQTSRPVNWRINK
jgi:hypothetical protein